ncbi:lactonase family protein [Paenibacillus gansuensis]|uniref:Lactonase family protein n=1 Tax=Paenibacillus gansuensis TaxID=306542 RepID=A0ABW5PCR8_9BACL
MLTEPLQNRRMLVFAGSYAEEQNQGVYVYEFDESKEELTLLDSAGGLKNPTFLNVDPSRNLLYAIAEGLSPDGAKIAQAASFSFTPETGKLSPLHTFNTTDSPTCHIQRDKADSRLIVTSYHGGMVGYLKLSSDGSTAELTDTRQHTGGSVDPERQDRPHPHSSFYSPDGKFILVQDLGLDRIIVYRTDDTGEQLIRHSEVQLHPGAGPRHLTFHPNGMFAYVINELDSTVTAFRYHSAEGKLETIETVPTLPADYDGENGCAEIAISSDGRFLYGSNRGHDSLVVYSVDGETGRLSVLEHVPVEGKHPRHFGLTPNGTHLLAANRDTDNIAVFRVDRDSGRLTYTGHSVNVSKPVCIQPFYV